jgi:hypothetical protein
MNAINNRLNEECQIALDTFRKLNDEKHAEICSKLEYCIGSFNHDHNPSGLFEFAVISLNILKEIKEKNPRKINKKVIEGIEKAILDFRSVNLY